MPKRRRGHAQTDAPGGASANEWRPGASPVFSQGSNLKGQVTTAVRVTRTPCPSLGQEITITLHRRRLGFHQGHARASGISEVYVYVMGTFLICFGAMHDLGVVGLLSY